MSLRFGSGISGDEDSSSMYSRHTSYQTQLLEAFYREYPQPNDEQRREMSRKIGLDVKQIKFWYNNKAALSKGQVDRTDNSVIRAENQRISYENEALKEALNTILCSDCGGPSLVQCQHDSNFNKLLTENANLKQEYQKLSKVMVKYTGKLPFLHVDSPFTTTTPSSVMNNHQADGRIFQIPTNSTQSMMMNNYNNNVQQDAGIFEIPTSSTIAPSMMNPYNNAAFNQPQGIFGIPSNSTLTTATAPDGLMMPENNLLMSSSSSSLNGGLEQVTESDNNNAGVEMDKGPNPLAELMKLLA